MLGNDRSQEIWEVSTQLESAPGNAAVTSKPT